MDGLFAFVINRGTGNSGRIEWGKRGATVAVGIVDIFHLLFSAEGPGRLVTNSCRERVWDSRDLDTLETAIAWSAV